MSRKTVLIALRAGIVFHIILLSPPVFSEVGNGNAYDRSISETISDALSRGKDVCTVVGDMIRSV